MLQGGRKISNNHGHGTLERFGWFQIITTKGFERGLDIFGTGKS